MEAKYIFAAGVLIALGFGMLMEPENSGDVQKPPDFVQKTVRVEDAYAFAVQNQDRLQYIACYCGCAGMQHSDRLIQHGSLKDCYIRSDGSYEPHASECKLCNDITLEAKELFGEGYSLKEVRKIIDGRYSGRGAGTDTAMPP